MPDVPPRRRGECCRERRHARRWRWHSPHLPRPVAAPRRRRGARIRDAACPANAADGRRDPGGGQARPRPAQAERTTWDARLETSLIAVLTYLWRRGRGEKWAGLRRLRALRLLARTAGHGPGADHGLARHPADEPRRERRAPAAPPPLRPTGRAVRQPSPQERAAMAGLAASALASRRTRPSRTRKGSGGERSSSSTPFLRYRRELLHEAAHRRARLARLESAAETPARPRCAT